ncbi:hypothetical protein CISIN_1g006621mg [Citrus sinensis]|uniref:Integral membrane bound transporter domain-containing protein n=1 Tax=Citrus sinensis TaxID=2711 RepID=A0A067D600_CITSI|nr:hypothetical protein CISIN_1g006621mg [Citrus sinensis]
MWLTCLASAYRTACTIVGSITFYGPSSLRGQVTFPAFSYVTVILIVTDATLGDTLHGCWLALYATVQSIGPALLTMWLIGPARLTTGTTALAVAIAAFFVALPEGTHLVAKRIALGQIVLTYVMGFVNGEHSGAVMLPVRVAASTAIGVLACVLALFLPYPRLACYEVKWNYKQLADNASERPRLYVKALCAEDKSTALASISLAKSLTKSGTKHIQNIKRYQESMKWEIPFKFLRSNYVKPVKKFQYLEIPLRGMEMAEVLEELTCLTIKKVKSYQILCNSMSVPESNEECSLKNFRTIPTISQNLPFFFFLFCMKLLNCPMPKTDGSNKSCEEHVLSFKEAWTSWVCKDSPSPSVLPRQERQLSKVANVKAQGTVLGTVYGVLGCFLFEKLLPIRFLFLFPWFIFTSFLRHGRMYGQGGGISAVIGAVLILGRKSLGPPEEFAIARIVETFIGLTCTIIGELLFQSTRASTLAKSQLSKSLGTLHDCISSMTLRASQASLLHKQKRLKMHVNELGTLIGEADVEPNFGFLPFHSACYSKLLVSLVKMVHLLHFCSYSIGFLEQESQKIDKASWKEDVQKLDGDVKLVKEMACSSIKCFNDDITTIKSLAILEKELERKKINQWDFGQMGEVLYLQC